MTVWTDNAAAFATRDRVATADLILTDAVREVVAAYRCAIRLDRRLGHEPLLPVSEATAALAVAGEKAARLLGVSS